MLRIISALLLSISSLALAQQPPKPLELADDAPDRHIVVPGDTLWGISGKFLKDPHRWPEVWRMNPEEIRNPHLIYPGQVVVLDRSGGDPRLRLGRVVKAEPRVYVEDQSTAIPSIPQQVIAPFLSEPLVVEADALDKAPRVVATQEDRVFVGSGNLIYVTGLTGRDKVWQVYRPARPLKDPETGDVLGHEAYYLGNARLKAEGDPATLEVMTAREEIGRNDRLIPISRPDVIQYAPHSPAKSVKGRVMSVYGGVGSAGRNSIVTVSRGARDGLEIGHVLALYRAGAASTNRYEGKRESFTLPDERYGLLFVFRVFDRVAYGLVLNVSRPVELGDVATNP
ncbi:MAG: LysM peptidoglycan-binding domain-containing protein [Rhodocyclaceae bacterium]|nr:LysM peptidoglycan-binding domain-containing protein [Rhodocyclaceae bacterium]